MSLLILFLLVLDVFVAFPPTHPKDLLAAYRVTGTEGGLMMRGSQIKHDKLIHTRIINCKVGKTGLSLKDGRNKAM